MNRLARETERRMHARDGSPGDLNRHIQRLETEIGLLQVAGDAMRGNLVFATLEACNDLRCRHEDCESIRQWDRVRGKGASE